ncbi:MAG: aminoglycoside phosphotransferase family protein [Lentisphaeria bacterium]|nr:aminoglycoside phosphotransferase family protein [Lentisphaeria bacterium]
MENIVTSIASNFCIDSLELTEVKLFGSGHINETYLAGFKNGDKVTQYIFQKINTNVFRKPEQLMDNISRVLKHAAQKLADKPDSERRSIHLVPAKNGKMYCYHDNHCWRAYHFIGDASTYNILETEEQAYQAAKTFGAFQMLLADLPGERLFETIPNFHNTPSRYADFERALAANKAGRADLCREEIEFAKKISHIAPVLIDLQKKGEIPERITHNDTKLNNVLLDDATGEGLCVIDLDTVMPGLSLYDFGDMVRTSVSPAAEDETDLSKIKVRTEVFKALVKGYLDGAEGCLTAKEMEMLPFSGYLITYEIGLRFLTDYLEGDVYFRTHREHHNLDRCRTQFKLVQLLMEKEDELNAIVKGFIK